MPHPRVGSTIPGSFTLRNLPRTGSLGSLGFCQSIATSWQSRLAHQAAFFCLHNEIDFHITGAHVTIATKIILLLQKGKLFESFKLRYPVHKTVHLISSWQNTCTILSIGYCRRKRSQKGAAAGSENHQKRSSPGGLHHCSYLLGCTNRGEGPPKSMQI